MTRFLAILAFSVTLLGSLSAQKVMPAEQSDSKAKALLDKLRTKYDSYKTITGDFKLTIKNGDDKEVQTGKIYLSGEKYRFEMKDQDVICDAKTVWFHQKKNNELQINSADAEDDNILSPAKMFKMYETSSKVIYSLMGEVVEGGKTLQQIEFKPRDRNAADYAKIRMSIDKATSLLVRVEVFGKDGMQYFFDITKINPDGAIDSSKFTFDDAHFKGNKTDLR